MPQLLNERTARPHEFWLATCDYDTYRRGRNYARLDTPWNAFTRGNTALVCTLWVDRIVAVFDAVEQRERQFIRLGGRAKEWKGPAVKHGREARSNLDDAIKLRIPVFGFEAEPNAALLRRGERAVEHFYLDRARQLKPWIGLRLEDLNERLKVDGEFVRRGIIDDVDPGASAATLFELIEVTAEIPGSKPSPAEAPELKAGEAPAPASEEPPGEEPMGEEPASEAPASEDEAIGAAFEGHKSADEYAREALPLLVSHVLTQTDGVLVPLTYQRLAELLDRRTRHGEPWARGLGHVLGRVTALIDAASEGLPEEPPFLTTTVVLSTGADAGLPAKGVVSRWSGYAALSAGEKRAKVSAEYQRILQFGSRWNDVLRAAGLTPLALPAPVDTGRRSLGGWGGGESVAHKRLKRFVLEHPAIVGAEADWFAQEEYALRSGDEIDVMFKSDHLWIGVEVKSRVSDAIPSDYERGLYQVVKYRAVLAAQAQVDHPKHPPQVVVVLALETALPVIYRDVAAKLSVNCVEGLRPT